MNLSDLHSLASVGDEQVGVEGQRVLRLIHDLSRPDCTRDVAQTCVGRITEAVLPLVGQNSQFRRPLLVPILRAGAAMWGAANAYFNSPETSFVFAEKKKGTHQVDSWWPKKSDFIDRDVIILDPIIATGDTVRHVCSHVMSFVGDQRKPRLTVIACYAAREGMQNILASTPVDIFAACVAEGVTPTGYLIPSTNGDLGDKLFN